MKRKEKENQLILQNLYPNLYKKQNNNNNMEILEKGIYTEYPFNDQDYTYTEAKYDLNLSTGIYDNNSSHFD
jgi:hypothetical protein